jgi:hypothetical protein
MKFDAAPSFISKRYLTFGRITVGRNLTLLRQAKVEATCKVPAGKKKLEKACSTRSNYNASGSQEMRTKLEKRDQ